MSFSADLKTEILESRRRPQLKKAQAYGLFACARGFDAAAVSISTEHAGVARLFSRCLQDFLGRDVKLAASSRAQRGKILYGVKLAESRDRERLLAFFGHSGEINMDIMPGAEPAHAFLSGAFLACGNITDPQKSYHIEFAPRDKLVCDGLAVLLGEHLPGVKRTERRKCQVLYYKEYAQIEDLLTLMGAPKACLAMIDVEMIKSVHNHANRATNCETANIDKIVDAAAQQLLDIRLVLEVLGGENLPEPLRQVIALRLENPDASLRELAELAQPAVSRSGMFHRLGRLSKMADEIRRGEAKA